LVLSSGIEAERPSGNDERLPVTRRSIEVALMRREIVPIRIGVGNYSALFHVLLIFIGRAFQGFKDRIHIRIRQPEISAALNCLRFDAIPALSQQAAYADALTAFARRTPRLRVIKGTVEAVAVLGAGNEARSSSSSRSLGS
jgi:hypothetical protein